MGVETACLIVSINLVIIVIFMFIDAIVMAIYIKNIYRSK